MTAAVAVWLNGSLYYTDTPIEEGTPAEDVALPPLLAERYGAIEVPLYDASAGDTLIIGQTAPLISEIAGKTTVYPCSVEVESLYGYERGLIAPAYDVGMLCAFLGIVGLALCIMAVWQKDAKLLLLALMTFVRMGYAIAGMSFFSQYTLLYTTNFNMIANLFSFTLLLLFLATQLDQARGIAFGIAAAHGVSVAISFITQISGTQIAQTFLLRTLPEILTSILLLAELGVCLWAAHKGNEFSRVFLRILAIWFGVWLLYEAMWLAAHRDVLSSLMSGRVYYAQFLREPIIWLTKGAVLVTAMIFAYRHSVSAREQRVYAVLRAKAVQESYENLMAHQNEVMMLRHEMNRHYTALKGLLAQEQVKRAGQYLDELLSQQENVPKVVNSGNELVNIILNSRVAWAQSLGLQVEIERMNVPAQLPLTDADVASLILNIMDNAIEAARNAEKQPGIVRLNMNSKNDYFTFCCENTTLIHYPKEEKSPYHGYGLHIIERIMAPYGKLMTVRREVGLFSITIALPLTPAFNNHNTQTTERGESV